MNQGSRRAVVMKLSAELTERGSWSGETHIQKALYLLQELCGVPTEFEFILYKHGPFSFDLRDFLSTLRADGDLDIRMQPAPYGPSLVVPDERLARVSSKFPRTLGQYGKRIEFIAKALGNKRVSDLERLATAQYVTSDSVSDLSAEHRAQELVRLKPHVDLESARAAVSELDQLTTQAAAFVGNGS